jgi:hypothetical protein
MPFGVMRINESLALVMVVIVLLILTIGAVYYGFQSLKQAALLANPIPIHKLGSYDGQTVAVYGRPRRIDLEDYGYGTECVWMEIKWQEFPKGNDFGSWRTVRVETKAYNFLLEDGQGNSVMILNDATEVHGTITTTGAGLGKHRKNTRFLQFAGNITVVGRAVAGKSKESYSIVKDSEVGMLLSSVDPKQQASSEELKGWASMVAVVIGWIALAVYIIVH